MAATHNYTLQSLILTLFLQNSNNKNYFFRIEMLTLQQVVRLGYSGLGKKGIFIK